MGNTDHLKPKRRRLTVTLQLLVCSLGLKQSSHLNTFSSHSAWSLINTRTGGYLIDSITNSCSSFFVGHFYRLINCWFVNAACQLCNTDIMFLYYRHHTGSTFSVLNMLIFVLIYTYIYISYFIHLILSFCFSLL